MNEEETVEKIKNALMYMDRINADILELIASNDISRSTSILLRRSLKEAKDELTDILKEKDQKPLP